MRSCASLGAKSPGRARNRSSCPRSERSRRRTTMKGTGRDQRAYRPALWPVGSAWRFARGNEFHRVLGEKISTSDRRNAELAAGRPIEVADIAEAERWVRANLPAIEARALAEASAFSDRQRGVTAQASRPAAAARPAADDDFSVSVWVHGKFVDAKNMGDLGRLMAEAARWRGPGSAGAW